MDESGRPSDEAIASVRRLVNGYQVSQALHVVARLGVPDLLAGGPRRTVELASETSSHEESLYRVLRAVAAVGVLEELPGGRFQLTEMGHALRSDVPGSLAGWAAFIGRPYYWKVWARLIDGVATGGHAFRLEHGTDVWSYRRDHPGEVAVFNRAMNSATGAVTPAVVAGYDFTGARTIADIGGGGGVLLTEVLAANPGARGILFDLAPTIEDARAFVAASAAAGRCELVAGDFFESVPEADVYLLKSILHDWYDEDASRILASIRRAAHPDSVLLVIEPIIAGPNEGAPGKFADLNMMVAAGGRERTRTEWEQILGANGWRLEDARPAGPSSILVTRPA